MPTEQELTHEQGLRRQLSAGQMAMVAVGGSIGTGLLLGTAPAIELAGPAVILSFVLAAFINWTVALALGELACAHPAAGSFGVYGDLYLNDWAGFLSRGGYWAAIAVSIGAEMVAATVYMAHWFPRVDSAVWIALFSLLLLVVNFRGVGSYGRFEFWFAMIKVVVIAAFIVLGAFLLLSGKTAPQFTTQGGFFARGFLAPLLAMTFAIYTFGGVEFVAVTSGESRSREDVAQAVRITFGMLMLLYLGAITVLVGILPWNRAGVTESPFVSVFRSVSLPGASDFMNFVVLTAALSGANAALYVSSRMLFSMARNGWAPAILGHLNAKGSPNYALLVSAYGIVVALVLTRWAPAKAFEYILRGAFFGMILSWVVSLAAHISFRRRATPAEIADLPLRSPLGGWGSIIGLTVICAVILKGWYDSGVNAVCGVLYLILLTGAYVAIKATRTRSQ
ncbi:MAG TPA: amino acid permease [Terriglobales bacterium]|jgi:amino acid transporter, AAT family|nr:amino acid permease [Terriglobales bacterium]